MDPSALRVRASLAFAAFCTAFAVLMVAACLCTGVARAAEAEWFVEVTTPFEGEISPEALAFTPDGEIVISGAAPMLGPGSGDDFVAKFAADGRQLWIVGCAPGANQWQSFRHLGVDRRGNIYVASVIYEGDAERGVLASYRPSGSQRWQRTFPAITETNLYISDMVVSDRGEIYLSCFDSTWGGGRFWDLLKYDKNGRRRWVQTVRGMGSETMALDDSGNVCVTGEVTVDTAGDWREACITSKYSPRGDLLWSATYLPPERIQAFGHELRTIGDGLVVVGHAYGEGDVQRDMGFVIRYGADGTQQWVTSWTPPNGTDTWFGGTVPADGAGNIYVSAVYPTSGNYWDDDNTVILTIDPAGAVVGERPVTEFGEGSGMTPIGLDSAGDLVLAGRSLLGGSYDRLAFATMDADGSFVSSGEYAVPGMGWVEPSRIVIGPDGALYVAGYRYPESGGCFGFLLKYRL